MRHLSQEMAARLALLQGMVVGPAVASAGADGGEKGDCADARNRALAEENAALARENATLKERLAAAATSTASEARPAAKQGLTSKTTVETTAPAPAPPGGSLKEDDQAQLRRRIALRISTNSSRDTVPSLSRSIWPNS